MKVVTKAKAKSNVLDKMPGKKAGCDSAMDTSSGSPAEPLPPSGMTASQAAKMEELVNEVNKLKAIVLKHEVRIRDLEKKVESAGGANGETGNGETAGGAKNNGDAH